MNLHPSPFAIEWRCPTCRSTYLVDVGECGQNIPTVCRDAVRPVLAPSADAIIRGCEAFDTIMRDGGPDEQIVDRVLRAALEDCDSFATLLAIARAIVDLHYPEDVFTDAWREDMDPGHKLVVAVRACDEARRERKGARTS